MFAENVYTPADGENRVSELIRAMPICLQADAYLTACKKEKRQPTADEAAVIAEADGLRDKLVQVDVHTTLGALEAQEGYVRPAITSTLERQSKGAASFGASLGATAASA